ncbi:vacuolar protein sorting-associated protein 13B isoform X3 [Osmia bicornis bicornis]|uniref:vacuolar protein sorting-associated protein 13B isoform X3 n=1 Tax=Osmia bicornis bicornis TaxID=1437191 RepID=UPI001EAEAAC4|nr:vacuolar protein sorting-associated protein 13B isoform X3 [Osmia bicornis bicornis]
MFKLESYITPVILSYVEKYVKNFKPEQSQVSLWGGDASFQNLDLRLEVLEEQLNLPFVFVSGHIHELLIHVPWVKITSEPIVITINTIECILKLKDDTKVETNPSAMQKRLELPQEETPPGYIKSIVTKVVNNITINCNNLILKYVEEDIVLSVNVRFLSMQTVNNKWEPTFTDVNGYEVMLRKVVTIQDLTLCLDKMDASGKIEIYQDPVLYRCSVVIRLIVNYHSNTAKKASITRLDLHCQKMEFSITEQQVPMLLRLAALIMALQTKQFPSNKEKSLISMEEREDSTQDDIDHVSGVATETSGWGGWAWNVVSSLLPIDWDNDWSTEQQMAYSGHTIHLGIYVQDTTLTFKTVENVKEQLFYKSRKLRYKSFLTLRLNGVVVDTLLQGIAMTSFQVGMGCIRIYPRGTCSCGHLEVVDGAQPPLYFIAGKLNTDYLKDSLFDNDSVENKGKKREYKQGIYYYLCAVSEERLIERCPAFAMDYVHCVELPDDITPEKLAEFGSNFEYSNFHERRVMRYIIGDLTVRLCSGIFHRIETIKQAAANYDYNPYIVTKPDPLADELPPVTLEEYEALRENVSMAETKLIVIKASLQLQLADHSVTGLPRHRKIVESRTAPLTPALTDDPFLSIECDEAIISVLQPLYPFRLAACASKQTDLSTEMFSQCHKIVSVQVNGAKSQLYLTKSCHTSIVMPYSVECKIKKLLYPQYWRDIDLIHETYTVHMDSITITGTKAKLMIAVSILTSIFDPNDTTNPLVCSSLFSDACQETDPVYLELLFENVNCKKLSSLVTVSYEISMSSVKMFALNESQQAFVFSGPESNIDGDVENKSLLTAVIQFPKDIEKQTHPPLISLQMADIRASLDPLLFKWLEYRVTYYNVGTLCTMRPEMQQHLEGASSDTGTKKKTFPSLHESVHSSSDKEKRKSIITTEKSKTVQNDETQKKYDSKTSGERQNLQNLGILARLSEWYPWWGGLVLSGCVGHIVIYIPSMTMSGIGAYGIEEAKDGALKNNKNLQILIIKLPALVIHSSNVNFELLTPYLQELPVVLPKSMWTNKSQSFPWTLSLVDFHCYMLQEHTQKNFIKKMSLNATVALTTKVTTFKSESVLSALGVCVHIDNSPIIVSISEEQVVFMNKIISSIASIVRVTTSANKSVITSTQMNTEAQVVLPIIPQTPSTPTQLLYPEDTTTNSTVSTSKDDTTQDTDELVLTAWIQWTITKIAIKLYVTEKESLSSLKLVLELEDIITSLDLQPVYFKLKSKITTVTIFHYTRAPNSVTWDIGEYVGAVLCGREDSLEKGDDSGFLSFTLTRAKSGNVHTRWGTYKKHKTQKKDVMTESVLSTNSYISEVVIKVQMMDLILPLTIVSKYMQLIKPFTCFYQSAEKGTIENSEQNVAPHLTSITNLDIETLPLIYLDFKGLRLMLPVSNTVKCKPQHDLLMFQLDGVRITPHAENPICRTPLRLDIYQLAAQANILSIPGSAVEDRQYQINIKGICAHTTTWKNYQLSINKKISQSYLYTMNENPALEWNKLGHGSSLERQFSTLPLLSKFDLCLIIAPPVLFKPDITVCGSAIEVNCITDIEVTLNLDQIHLITVLNNELKNVLLGRFEQNENVVTCSNTSQKLFASMEGIKQITWTKQSSNDTDVDFTKDSGIDFETSSVNSTIVGKPPSSDTSVLLPFEFLVNCGKITFILYDIQETVTEYQVDINEVEEEEGETQKQPLLYVMVNQPNIYFSQQHPLQKIQVSCFDITVALGEKERRELISIPTEKDFKVFMIETKNGDLHPDTGIPPSFITVKYEKTLGKNPQFSVDMGRPTKIHFSLSRLSQMYIIKNKILTCFVDQHDSTSVEQLDDTKVHSVTKSKKLYWPDLNMSTKQLVLSLKTDSGAEIITSLSSLSGNISSLLRPDRIYSNTSVDSFIISVILNENIKVLLNPWCCNITICLLWETWQNIDSIPQVQIQADSDSLYLDFGPEQIKIIKNVMEDCQLLLSELTTSSSKCKDNEKQIVLSTEQHYQDDLKAGAFQFVNGNADELPFPYQVIFFTYPQQSMAWRYPQPRTLTRIHVSPVPFETLDSDTFNVEKVLCTLEYWSDCHMSYQRYADFYLSETDSYRLELPEKAPARAVACIWRVVLLSNSNRPKAIISARVLAACLRIDSYFNSSIIPNIQAALNIGAIHVCMYNHISTTMSELHPPLNNYTLKGTIPETQCFMTLEHKGAILVLNRWIDGSTLIDIGGTFGIHILDYSYLTMQEILDPLEARLQLSLSDKTDISLTCSPFSLKLSPTVAHTLAVSTHLWFASLEEENKNMILFTRYVIANNSNVPILFGQSGTGENILLESRQCNFYSWRHISNKMLRIAIKENSWLWSKPFSVGTDGIQAIEFSNSTMKTAVFVSVASISAMQKLVTFCGQLVISNQLIDNFEMKLVRYEADIGSKVTVLKDVYPISGKSRPPSVILDGNKKMAIRLRFTNAPNLSWTGDIPLQPNVKWGQPWLVKVPLQERGQFLSIWVRIVTQTIQERTKVLAVLSPLYMIRSHLPVPVRVQMDTPSLKTSLSTMVNGRGERQQLYCPGTFEHFHQLTFQLESGVSTSNPYVPLSYSSVDQRKFFRRPETEDIDEILKNLENQTDETEWPFQEDEMEEWISAEQPQTHVQVKYQDAGLVSSTLLLELQPWCFILNSMGCYLSLVSEDIELCQIPHYGIITPPKLEGTFHLCVGIGDTFYTSQALQLARPDWSQSFYMPRIGGLIPVDGNVKTCVDCGSSVSIMSINSSMYEDMRLVRVTSSHVINNLTPQELCVATLAVYDDATALELPNDLTPFSFNISPSEDQKQGIPITQWYTLYMEEIIEPLALYISLSLGHKWSCPVRVDQGMSRKCVAVPNGSTTMPVVITIQEDKGTTYIMIYVDHHPQLLIENTCAFKILLAQANETAGGIIPDTSHFAWICEIESNASCHYTIPSVSNRLPDTPVANTSNVLLFSAVTSGYNEQVTKSKELRWSRGINLSAISSVPMDQYVRLPSYGDVKLIMQNHCYTTFINILPISQVEVSARDIRSRLLRKENDTKEVETLHSSFSSEQEDDKTINVQSSGSSTSVTTFFSAQDDTIAPEMKTSQINSRLMKNVENVKGNENDDAKTIEESNSNEGSASICLRGVTIVIMHDMNENAQRIEVASLSMTDVVVIVAAKFRIINLRAFIGDLQLDNQLFDQGGFDFPVVLISQSPLVVRETRFYTSTCLMNKIEQIRENSLIAIDYVLENQGQLRVSKDLFIKIAPISAYIEDTYITQLLNYATSMVPPRFLVSDDIKKTRTLVSTIGVYIPDYIMVDAKILSTPLKLQNLKIEPVSILLSVHTSVRLYVALDHSPLYFGTFEKKNILTTPYRLGNALTMHYLSGAIFGAGWVVGSLEILGSPGSLAQALGSGLRDFVSLPFQGLLQGPWGFIVGITHGSASLMRHVTAGTLNSVTKLASSVARNLDRLTLDEEHLQRQEESRRMRPQGMAQGFYQGLTGLGMSLLAAVAGLAHHPLQQVLSGEITTKSLVTGVGLGLVGVVTKPLSGAAELVALTGQGLLQGAGWNSLPSPRQRPVVQYTTGNNNTSIKYAWWLLPLLENNHGNILHVTNADYVIQQGSNRAVTLVLTRHALLLVNTAEDNIERIYLLKDLISADHHLESTICLYCSPETVQTNRSLSPAPYEMDQEMRARVAEYVRSSSTGLASVSTNSDGQSDIFENTTPHSDRTLTFYVSPDSRNYLLSLFNIAKRQSQGSGFRVL